MNGPKLKTVKRLFAQSRNQCAYPNCITPMVNSQGIVLGEICHIKAKKPTGARYDPTQSDAQRNEFQNLILLCSNHHKIVDDQPKIYNADALIEMKKLHEGKSDKRESQEDEFYAKLLLNKYKITINNNSGTIIIDSPGAIKTDSLTLKTQKKNIKILPPENTISSEVKYLGYIKYLIDRYQEFAGSDKTRKYKFHYGTIYSSIKKEFGIKWDYVPKDNFNRLVVFLQAKIDRTRLARINKGKGYRSYDTFQEFCENKLKTN